MGGRGAVGCRQMIEPRILSLPDVKLRRHRHEEFNHGKSSLVTALLRVPLQEPSFQTF